MLSRRAIAAAAEFSTVESFFTNRFQPGRDTSRDCDFTFGNPHEMPLPGLVEALTRNAKPLNKDWFAYKTSEAEPRAVVAAALSSELGLPFEPEDIALTQGGFGAIALAFGLVLDPGDEVIIPTPGWFCYAPMLRQANLAPVKVALDPETFDPDLDAIDAAITSRTRMIVVNSPHNPSGRIYSADTLRSLADLVDAASDRIGARIWILSDEPYRRIRYDGIPFTSPASIYPWTLIDYSYGKVLLAPGQRLGYLALSPLMPAPEREALRDGMFSAQMALGWNFPNALMQHSVAALETVSIDLATLALKRDRMLGALDQWGYEMTRPEGTFYLWGKAPGGNGARFAEDLSRSAVFVMPGTLFERPAHFRISLTASMEMIERALPAFKTAAPA